jgi:hypothetical protein
MLKRSIFLVALLSILTLGNGSVPAALTLTPRTVENIASRAALPQQTVYAHLGTTSTSRQIPTLYFSPVQLGFPTIAGTQKYKVKLTGSKGTVVKSTALPAECSAMECLIEVEMPKPAQRYNWKVKAKGADGVVLETITGEEFRTSKPESPELTSPANGASAGSTFEVPIIFQESVGAQTYRATAIDPLGRRIRSPKTNPQNICDASGCGFVLSPVPPSTTLTFGTYTWRIEAIGDYGKGKSATWTFSVP